MKTWLHKYLSFILFYFILFYFILFYFILFYFILFYFILFYFILFYWDPCPSFSFPFASFFNRKWITSLLYEEQN
jgi:hypothetical protein